MNDERIYQIDYGGKTTYYHGHCLDEEYRVNINNLTPEQIERDRKVYQLVQDVPSSAVCSICFQPVK